MSNTPWPCRHCGLEHASSACPRCGGVGRSISVSAANELTVLDELGVQKLHSDGRLALELSQRTDGRQDSDIRVDYEAAHGTQIEVSATQKAKLSTTEDETLHVAQLVRELNAKRGTQYEVEDPSLLEKNGFPDRWLLDRSLASGHADRRVGVEVTHLDTTAIGDLNSTTRRDQPGQVKRSLTPRDVADGIAAALQRKHDKDEGTAKRTILLMTVPYALVPSTALEIKSAAATHLAAHPYREVWLSSFRETPFRLDG